MVKDSNVARELANPIRFVHGKHRCRKDQRVPIDRLAIIAAAGSLWEVLLAIDAVHT